MTHLFSIASSPLLATGALGLILVTLAILFSGLALGATVFTSSIANSLKETLEEIVDDDSDGAQDNMVMPRFLTEGKMGDNFVDDLEYGGPGLAPEKPEGTEMQAGTVKEGYLTRYLARTFALKLIVTEEALEDAKYPKAINAAKRLKRALYKTVDIDATNILVRMFSSSYVGGDGVALSSTAHTLPQGGTFSNQMATPQSPSRAALIVATTQMRKFPGHDGITEGYEPAAVVCPVDQWAAWEVILRSSHAPEPGEFNAINVIQSTLDIDLITNKYWTNTTTNWCVKTNADNGLKWLWRRKPKSNTWVDNDQQLMKYAISARWARGWSDPRAVLCVNA